MFQEIYPPITSLTREYLTTAEAAFYLNRTQQTLRAWAKQGGIITPARIHNRLAWPVGEVRKILGVKI